jgi:hypothetical protein
VRVDEKQVDGLDLEHQEEQHEALLAETKEAELPKLAGEEVHDLDKERADQLMVAMRMILERKHLNVTHLRMPQRETLALEALQAAVNGRSTNIDRFVYASDRRSMLEQALAVLQPNLTGGAEQQLAAMSRDFQILSKQVGELRDSLMNLEDGQDELLAHEFNRGVVKAGDAETTDKPKPPKSDPDAPRPASTLSKGDDVKAAPKTTTLSSGPDAKYEPGPSTLSSGPEAKSEPKATTLSTGPDATYESGPSTLSTGPEAKLERGPTTLGDEAEIVAEARKKPWWKRIIR